MIETISEIVKKFSGTFAWPSEQFWKIFGKWWEILRKSSKTHRHQYVYLLYGSVSQGLGTTKFTNLIGWNEYWPRSRFSHLDRHLDRECSEAKKLQAKMQNYWLLSSKNIYFCKGKQLMRKKSEEDELTLEELNSAHLRSQPKWQLDKPVTWNELNCSCFCHIINILLTELSRSVWENLDLGRVYRPHCVRSVLTTSVKILPYRPPARLIRAK